MTMPPLGTLVSMMHERDAPIWGVFTRLFHWSLVLAFCTSQLTAEEWDAAHEYSGYVIFGLISFRVIWGFVGPQHVQFREFVKSPSTIMNHLFSMLTGRHRAVAGHNPAGGAMIVVLLLWLGLTALSGWLSIELSGNIAEWFESIHETLGEFSLLLVAVHIAGVVVMSFLERQNLAKSMIDGKKHIDLE